MKTFDFFAKLTLTSIGLLSESRLPWQVVVEIFAVLAVQAFGVVGALASSVDHVVLSVESLQRQTTRSVTVAGAGTTNDHVRDGVVVLLVDLRTVIEQIVAE